MMNTLYGIHESRDLIALLNRIYPTIILKQPSRDQFTQHSSCGDSKMLHYWAGTFLVATHAWQKSGRETRGEWKEADIFQLDSSCGTKYSTYPTT